MIDRRTELFNGKYSMPRIKDMQSKDPRAYKELQTMFNAIWNSYLVKGSKGSISLSYWAQRVKSPKLMNIALQMLSEAGYITVTTQPYRNWSEAKLNKFKLLEWITEEKLISIRKQTKWNKYLLTNIEIDKECANLTNTKGVISNTGLYRPGFAKSAKTEFSFDIPIMKLYYSEVIELVNYGIEKTLVKYPILRDDLANYRDIGKEVIDSYILDSSIYNSGNRTSDPRGRNIAGYLNKIGNPVGYKIMRSLLVIPKANRNIATEKGLEAKYLFIAELAGYKAGTIKGKIAYGKQCYKTKWYPDLDLSNKDELKELPDSIWLERLYIDINNYFNIDNYRWIVPIELDASASIKSYYGLLLGHKPYLTECNVIVEDGKLNDAWAHDTITNRKQAKSVMRILYGSKQPILDMWFDMDIKGTREEAIAMEKDITTGNLAPANLMKQFMATHANMQPEMELNIWNEKFTVKCNKFYNRGEKTIKYDLYDSYSKSIKRIHHTETIKIPNLQQFKTWTSTGLIHHLDSRVMDYTCNIVYTTAKWCIDIHDAIIVDCEYAELARKTYASQINNLFKDRNSILENYFRSLNIPASALAEWKEIIKLVEPAGEFKCSPMVLK